MMTDEEKRAMLQRHSLEIAQTGEQLTTVRGLNTFYFPEKETTALSKMTPEQRAAWSYLRDAQDYLRWEISALCEDSLAGDCRIGKYGKLPTLFGEYYVGYELIEVSYKGRAYGVLYPKDVDRDNSEVIALMKHLIGKVGKAILRGSEKWKERARRRDELEQRRRKIARSDNRGNPVWK